MAERARRFWAELATVYESAGRPTLERLVQLGEQRNPPVKIGVSTLSDWLNGRTVPDRNDRYVMALVHFLQQEAAGVGSGYARRPEGWWQQLLAAARQERNTTRGGRPATRAASPGPPPGPVTLPPDLAGFTGRAAELAEILDLLEPDGGSGGGPGDAAAAAVVVSAGMGGVGKTALAVHAAHQARVRGWFPGGILFADLRGYSNAPQVEAGAVADRFLRALGVKTKDLPGTDEKLDAWRIHLDTRAAQGRPLLVILDNVREPGQIDALLPAAPHRALVTSRHTLSSLPARRVDLSPMSPADAVDLLDRTLRAGGTDDARVIAQHDDALRLARLCGRLPLALKIIGALLRDEPDRRLADQADELRDARTRLDRLAYDGDDDEGRPLALRASLELSYQHLTEPQQRALRLLAAAPGPDVSTAAAAALLGESATHARRLLAGLARTHLLEPATAGPERWAMHDLVRLFADDLGQREAPADGREPAVSRLLHHYLTTAQDADAHLWPEQNTPASGTFADRDQALAWLDAERSNLVAAALAAPAHHPAATSLDQALAMYFTHSGHFADSIRLSSAAAAVLREAGDRRREGSALNTLGTALTHVRDFEQAVDIFTEVIGLYRDVGDRRAEAMTLGNLGGALMRLERFPEAAETFHRAGALFRETGDLYSQAQVMGNMAALLVDAGKPEHAVQTLTEVVAVFRKMGDRRSEGTALGNLGRALLELGRLDEAVTAYTDAVAACRHAGERRTEGTTLYNLGAALVVSDRPEEAAGTLTDAITVCRGTGDRHGEAMALSNLGLLRNQERRFADAADHFTTAAALFGETGDRTREGLMLNSLGGTLVATGRLADAIDVGTRELEICREIGDRRGEGIVLTNLGRALSELGRFAEAADHLTAAVAVFRELGDPGRAAEALLHAARARAARGLPD
ncbi:tetratricopeptide repeat protein [Streptomyces sp. ISL-94]|uniref:ATP-binding protein n=1 Tax=Streptomyces sp. ISL-94 TaxID=2819190 RepID=UPI001BE80521|nr:tetratricopeptide repeat protein [Streptomyces sp. ISL-94]MBT2478183.1 tetratricopeptide repeat protein [Streptomyces sp. ISL-94]